MKPRFLADEDLRGDIVRAIRRLAPELELITIVEQGFSGITDKEVLEFASMDEWLILSHDVNTLKGEAEQRIKNGEGVRGVFFTAQGQPTRPIAESVVLIWEGSLFEEWEDRIVYLPL